MWGSALETILNDHNITDIVMLGDGRAVHAAAIPVATRLGARVHILEHGYLRPDWLTIEPDGMSAASRFPRQPDGIRLLANGQPPVASGGLWPSSFLTYALYDLAYHVPNVLFGWLVHPHYRTHGAVHPVVEYGGWIWKAVTMRRRQQRAARAIAAATANPDGGDAQYFLFPLQLPGDYQILRHAPGGNLFTIVDAVIASFAASAPRDARLLFKVHPIDNGLSEWPQRISAAAEQSGVAGRVFVADGGNTDRLIGQARGVVTVNSTVGLTALGMGRPTIALGAAIYDVPGLTFQGRLADFWTACTLPATLPDPALMDAFQRALAATTQVRGGFIGREAISTGAQNVADRLTEAEPRLPDNLRRTEREPFRYAEELGLAQDCRAD